MAVLSETRNRRTLTSLIVMASLLLGGAIAVPIAMLRAADSIQQSVNGDDANEAQNEMNDKAANENEVSGKQTAAPKSGGTAKTIPAAVEKKLRWGKTVDGLHSGSQSKACFEALIFPTQVKWRKLASRIPPMQRNFQSTF